MAIYNEHDWEENDQALRDQILARAINTDDTNPDYLQAIREGYSDTLTSNLKVNPTAPSAPVSITKDWDQNAPTRADIQSSFNKEVPDAPVVGTNFAESYLSNPKNAQQAMKDAVYRSAKLQSADFAINQKFNRFLHNWEPKMTAQEANAYAKAEGADIKFDHPVSSYEVDQSVNTFKMRESLQIAAGQAAQYRDESFGKNAAIIGAGLMGGVGPIELGASTAFALASPELLAGTVSGGANLAKGLIGAKRVEDASRAVQAATNVNKTLNVALNAEKAESVIGTVLKYNTPQNAQRFVALDKAIVKADGVLTKASQYSVAGMSGLEKTAADTLGFAVTDMPFIQATLSNSQQLGFDLYDEKDKAVDALFAAGLGIALPAGARAVGHVLGITPAGLHLRQIDDKIADVRTKKALGEISDETAEQAEKAYAEIRSAYKEQAGLMKKPAPFMNKAADSIQRLNVDNETYIAQQVAFMGAMLDGRKPKLSELPEFQSRMTHIDARYIRRLLSESFDNVFGDHIFRDIVNGKYAKVKLTEETGLLGDAAVGGLTERQALDNIERLYKGMVLGDKQALEEFKQYSESFSSFVSNLADMLEDYQMKYNANIEAKRMGQKPVYSAYALPRLEEQMQEAYIRMFFNDGKEADDLMEKIATNRESRALGFSDLEYSLPEKEAMDSFREWFEQYVATSEKGFTDFVDASGKKDQGRAFGKYLDELKDVAEGNNKLASTDDIVKNWEQDKVDAIVRSINNREVPADTDFQHLFAEPRVTGKEYRTQSESKVFWTGRLAQSKMVYAQMMNDPNYQSALRELKASSVINAETGSVFTRALDTIDKIKQLKEVGYEDIKKNIIEKVRTNENFLGKLDRLNPSDKRGMNFIIRQAVTDSLAEAGLSGTTINAKALSAEVGDRFVKLLDEHPEYLEAFTNAQDLKNKYQAAYEEAWENLYAQIPEKGVDEGAFKKIVADYVAEPVARINTAYNQLFDQLLDTVDISLSRAEMQNMHDVSIATTVYAAMRAHPEDVGEVLEGLATQNHGTHFGNGLSVEYLTKTAGFYSADIKNKLASMDSKSGQSLLDIYRSKDPEVIQNIRESIIKRKHGETTKNADADRIAEVLDDEMSTFLSSFRKFGSNYDGLSLDTIKRSKLKYIDGYMTDTVAGEMGDQIQRNFYDSLPDDLIVRAQQGNEKASVKWGEAGEVIPTEKFREKIDKEIATMAGTASKLFNQYDETSGKMALWAFRDFDLDAMFDPHHTETVSLNQVRDMLLNNQVSEYVADDLYKLKYVNKAFKRIVSSLVGKDAAQVDGKYLAKGDSWVMRYRSGFVDIGAVATGRKAAAVDAIESGIRFKNSDAEINVAKYFGYDSTEEQVLANYDKVLQAYQTIDKFGTTPHQMVEMLIDTYEASRKKGEFAKELTERYIKTMKVKKDANFGAKVSEGVNTRYAITENKKKEILDMVDLAAGLQSFAPSAMTKVIKTTTRLLSTGLLGATGVKSLADYGTVVEGLVTNGLVRSRGEAWSRAREISAFLLDPRNRDIKDMVIAANVLQHDNLAKIFTNDMGADMVSISKNMTTVDKAQQMANNLSDAMLRGFGMAFVTNNNKQVAALLIQMGMADAEKIPFDQLKPDFKVFLHNYGITKDDWNFMRATLFVDPVEQFNKTTGADRKLYGKKFFVPGAVKDIPDKVWREELKRRGVQNITAQTIQEFKDDFIGKAWTMVDASSDELVSIPSQRVNYELRFRQAQNSKLGSLGSMFTQFQSFGAALTYSTYWKRLQSFASQETGLTAIDMLLGRGARDNISTAKVYGALLVILADIGLTTFVVNQAAGALKGNIKKPGSEGFYDDVQSALIDSTGIAAPFINAAFDGLEYAGLRGGGLNIQMNPSLTAGVRSIYNILRPLRNEKVYDKGSAFAAGVAIEAEKYMGLRNLPIVAPVLQAMFGSYLEEKYYGGPDAYFDRLHQKEERGQWIAPWETGQPLGGLLQ